MNITKKIIITDTNIITDLSNANILKKFVKLDNVYIVDIVKNDEINSDTGDKNSINSFKTLEVTSEQIIELFKISKSRKGLSQYDIINFIVARDNDAILATGDNKLKNYSEENGVEVIRTLKIIELMYCYKIINFEETLDACILLKNNKRTRIPKSEIDNMIDNIEKNKAV